MNPCIRSILILAAGFQLVSANPILPAIVAVGRDAVVTGIVQWTLTGGLDAAKAYWAGPVVTPYIHLIEVTARHAEFEKGTGKETVWAQTIRTYLALQPNTTTRYHYSTRTRTVPVIGKPILAVSTEPFTWDGLERRTWYCSGTGDRPSDLFPTYEQFSMRFKLGAFCSLAGAREGDKGPWPTKVIVGRTTRQAGCDPVHAHTENLVRSIAIPASGSVCFEWDGSGNHLYEDPKFLRDRPDERTPKVNVLPHPRLTKTLPSPSAVPMDPSATSNE